MNDVEIYQGMSPAESAYPEELALGNIVKLKDPYRPTGTAAGQAGDSFTHGIIVEQLTRNAFGMPLVSLHLYNPQTREIYLGPNGIPEYVDTAADEILLWKIAAETGYAVCGRDGSMGGTELPPLEGGDRTHEPIPEDELGWDMHPPCSAGHKRQESHPFGENADCEICHGWGYQRRHVPLPTGAQRG